MALWVKTSLCIKSSLLEQSLPRTPSRPKTSAISAFSAVKNSCLTVLVAKNLCNLLLKICVICGKNLRNLCPRYPRLINDLRSTKVYVRKNNLFMQNEPKFRKSQMNVTNLITKDYEKRTLGQVGKTNPKRTQTNPKRTQTNPNSKRPK